MKKIYTILFTAFCAATFVSCEEDVMLDLKKAEPVLVIEAVLSENNPCGVLLTKTQDYYDTSLPQPVSGAEIILEDKTGRRIETLVEQSDSLGYYVSSNILGKAGDNYSLKVKTGGKTYEANSTLPHSVPIDSIRFKNFGTDFRKMYMPIVYITDPGDVDNYYYYTLFINNKKSSGIFLADDYFKNGKVLERMLASGGEHGKAIEPGDNVLVEMRSISKGAFDYYFSMFSIASGGGTNPISNFSGGALGFFNAYSVTSYSVYFDESLIIK